MSANRLLKVTILGLTAALPFSIHAAQPAQDYTKDPKYIKAQEALKEITSKLGQGYKEIAVRAFTPEDAKDGCEPTDGKYFDQLSQGRMEATGDWWTALGNAKFFKGEHWESNIRTFADAVDAMGKTDTFVVVGKNDEFGGPALHMAGMMAGYRYTAAMVTSNDSEGKSKTQVFLGDSPSPTAPPNITSGSNDHLHFSRLVALITGLNEIKSSQKPSGKPLPALVLFQYPTNGDAPSWVDGTTNEFTAPPPITGCHRPAATDPANGGDKTPKGPK